MPCAVLLLPLAQFARWASARDTCAQRTPIYSEGGFGTLTLPGMTVDFWFASEARRRAHSALFPPGPGRLGSASKRASRCAGSQLGGTPELSAEGGRDPPANPRLRNKNTTCAAGLSDRGVDHFTPERKTYPEFANSVSWTVCPSTSRVTPAMTSFSACNQHRRLGSVRYIVG